MTLSTRRAAGNNTRSRFAVPPARDAHFHLFEPGYPHAPDPLYNFPEGTLAQYLRMTEVLGIEGMVLVQPTLYGTDNTLLIDTLRKVGPQCRGVVGIEDDTSDAVLDRFHEPGSARSASTCLPAPLAAGRTRRNQVPPG